MNWLEFWYIASASPFGIELTVSDPEKVKQKLYQARAGSPDRSADLDRLTIRTGPMNPGGSLWIVPKREGTDAQEK